ncbi:Vacuolar protein-sorting-associated protein 28 [Xylographa parallela]|nr:Vacuolar protein-sorting-associated protein 28 [Xylographa parallela]
MYTSSRLPSYAPSPYSYTPDTTLNATINLDEVQHPISTERLLPPTSNHILSHLFSHASQWSPIIPTTREHPNKSYPTSTRSIPSPRDPYLFATPQSPTPHLSANTPPLQEVKLPRHGTAERELLDSLAEIYSIVVVLDDLERAYTRDSVSETEYTDICSRLIKQYSSALSDERVRREFGDLESFKKEYDEKKQKKKKQRTATEKKHTWTAPAPRSASASASPRPSSTPATPPPRPPRPTPSTTSHPPASTPSASAIANATENFITFLDALRIKIRAKDQLHPLLSEVIQSANKVVAADFEGRGNIVKWLIRLNGMRAGESLGEEETRECAFELEGAYAGFKARLGD